MSTPHSSILHIEVCLKSRTNAVIRTDLVRDEVSAWLRTCKRFAFLQPGSNIEGYECLSNGADIEQIRVVDSHGPEKPGLPLRTTESHLEIYVYEPYMAAACTNAHDEESPSIRVTQLPNRSLEGLWESLIFDDGLPSRLLRLTTRMMTLTTECRLSSRLLNWNRLYLFHGPPGTGKSSLCRALAQKLSIRLTARFTQSRLVEVNANSVLSKWFGESGRFVEKMFAEIISIEDPDTTLICVLIDEIESLSSSRQRAAESGECGDALRATNQLLTALDEIRQYSNILIFCTSNLISLIDSAFLDRVDMKQYVSHPSHRSIYNIIKSCIEELFRCDLVVSCEEEDSEAVPMPFCPQIIESGEVCPVQSEDLFESLYPPSRPLRISAPAQRRVPAYYGPLFRPPSAFPSIEETRICLLRQRPNSPGARLWRIAEAAAGLSGRRLRRLMFLAVALRDDCSADMQIGLHRLLDDLAKLVKEEKLGTDVSVDRQMGLEV